MPASAKTSSTHTKHSEKKSNLSTDNSKTDVLPAGWKKTIISPESDDTEDKINSDNSFDNKNKTEISTIFLPLRQDYGIAAFQTAQDFTIAIDHSIPLDISSLNNNTLYKILPLQISNNSTIIHIHSNQPDIKFFIQKKMGGWLISTTPLPSKHLPTITPEIRDQGVLFHFPKPGHIVTLPDEKHGGRILVGTSSEETAPVTQPRSWSNYEINPSLQGLVISTTDNSIELRSASDGAFLDFSNSTYPHLQDLTLEPLSPSDADWSWLTLSGESPEALNENFKRFRLQAATSPQGLRTKPRLSAARMALAINAPKETRAILEAITSDDPESLKNASILSLQAVSGLLVGDMDAARPLSSIPPPPIGDDEALWSGLYKARTDSDKKLAANLLANGWSRLQAYPAPLRNNIAPEIAETIARYGSADDLISIATLPDAPEFQLTKGLLLLRAGNTEKALKTFVDLSSSPSPRFSMPAQLEAISLKEKNGSMTHQEAANALENLRLTARLVDREENLLLALMRAYANCNDWSHALITADALTLQFPDHSALLTPDLLNIVTHLSESSPPETSTTEQIDTAALISSHIEQLPDSPEKANILASLAERLNNLGLQAEASNTLGKALPLTDNAQQRAEWGMRLATMEMEAGHTNPARQALDATSSPQLPDDLQARRRFISAQLFMDAGNPDKALQIIGSDKTDAALDLHAHILETTGKWEEATYIVSHMAGRSLPRQGPLDSDQQALALRLATDASHANNARTLEKLKQWIGDRITDERSKKIFDLLTTSTGKPQQNARTHAEPDNPA